jgi:TolB-like protein/DNA-binding winged helix-turn-helix (wHTH) protein/Flp pilus assembly protein TadD
VAVSVQSPPGRLRFGKFELDPASGELHQSGHKIPLAPKAFELLRALVERAGQVVTREELRAKLWAADTFVEFDDSLNHTVKKLRQALGDSAENPQFIETLPRYGYRFIAPLQDGQLPETVAEPARRRRRSGRIATAAIVAAFAVLAVMAPLLAFNVGDWRTRFFGRTSRPPIRSLAVLPLSNLSGDPQQDYFADGMTDALITDLAKIGALKVISRTSVMRFKGTREPLAEIAKNLEVDGILEGSVQRSGQHVRITVQLVRAATDSHLWAESYERDVQDVLRLQSEIAQAVAREIKVALTPEESTHLIRARTVNPEAYELYLKGRYEYNKRSEEGMKKGLEYFQQAITLDPNYAEAHSGVADSYAGLWAHDFVAGTEVYLKARAATLKALELDPALAEGHASLAFLLFNYDRDREAALREYEIAIQLNPNYAAARSWYADSLAWMGRSEEAVREIEQARRVDPVAAYINGNVAYELLLGRQYDRAIVEAQKAIELEPSYAFTHAILARIYIQKQMYKEALVEAQARLSLQPTFPKASADLALAYAYAGERKEALKILHDLEERSKREYVAPYAVARAYVGMDEKEQALGWLEKGFDLYDGDMHQVNVDPALDPLRSDPRFQNLLRRMSFRR